MSVPDRDPLVWDGKVIADNNPFREILIKINHHIVSTSNKDKIRDDILILADQLDECGCPYFANRWRYVLDIPMLNLSGRLYMRKMFLLQRFYMTHHAIKATQDPSNYTVKETTLLVDPIGISHGHMHHKEWNDYLDML